MNRCVFWVCCLALAGCGARETVVVYSPHGPDVLRDYERRFEAAYPEVDVQWIDMGSQTVYERVKSERHRPRADVWWGAPSSMFIQAAAENLLEPHRPGWAEGLDITLRDPEYRWLGVYRSPLAIVFNTRRHTRETAPQTWDDLLDPEWHGKITLRDPLPSGTMRTFIGAMMQRAGDEDAGIEWLRRLHAATRSYMGNPQLLFDHMKRNEELVTVWLLADAMLQRERHGYPFDCVAPPATPVLIEGIAVLKDAPHPEWAARFVEFVTTPEALAHQAEAYAKIPTRADLEPDALPDWIDELAVDPLPIDWAEFARLEQARMNRWEKEVFSAR